MLLPNSTALMKSSATRKSASSSTEARSTPKESPFSGRFRRRRISGRGFEAGAGADAVVPAVSNIPSMCRRTWRGLLLVASRIFSKADVRGRAGAGMGGAQFGQEQLAADLDLTVTMSVSPEETVKGGTRRVRPPTGKELNVKIRPVLRPVSRSV